MPTQLPSTPMSGRIPANAFSSKTGGGKWYETVVSGETVRAWANNSYVTYASVVFRNTTKGIKVNYSMGQWEDWTKLYGGAMEIRLGGPTGTIIAKFAPSPVYLLVSQSRRKMLTIKSSTSANLFLPMFLQHMLGFGNYLHYCLHWSSRRSQCDWCASLDIYLQG